MGTLSSGVGLISGLDIENVVSQLMEIEAQPRTLIENRLEILTAQRTSMMSVQAKVMAVQLAAASFNKDFVFQQKTVTSNNENIMTATGNKFAAEGTYRFVVKRLASNHHFVSRGYTDLDSSLGSGTLSFEIGQGQLAKATDLSFINGQSGFQRGRIQITDRAGNTAEIDLRTTLTVQDILDEINKNITVNVTASVSGDNLVITDNSGGTGNLIVADIGDGHTAADLGIRASVAGDTINGSDIISLTADTKLSEINDGNGVRGLDSPLADIRFTLADASILEIDLKDSMHETIGDDTQSTTLQSLNKGAGVRTGKFRITDQNGRFIDVDMNDFYTTYGSNATLGQLKTYIETAASDNNMDITVGFGGLDHLKITDNSEGFDEERASNFMIEDLDGGSAAEDLGIADEVEGANIIGEQIWYMETVGDIVNAVNNNWNNNGNVNLAIDLNTDGIHVTDNTGGAGNLVIEAINTSLAADDLGLTTPTDFTGTSYSGRRLIAGLNTVMLRSLNGGSGGDPNDPNYGGNRITEGGIVSLTDRSGNTTNIDLAGVFTVQDVLDAINDTSANTTNIRARIDNNGHGIILEDSSVGGGNLIVADVGEGTIAQKLGIAVNDAVGSIDSGNLQVQYISEASQLSELRQGQGIRRGQFTITDGLGQSATIDLARDQINTLEDVIDEINQAGTGIRARINDSGDGLLLYDTSAGTNLSAIKVQEKGGNTAHDLGLLRQALPDANGNYTIDGSYEFKLQVGGGDSIEDVINKINEADIGVQASIINDGTSYRISFVSEIDGRAGMVYLDAGTTNLTTDTLSVGRDAVVFLGEGSDEHPLVISSSSNTIENAIKGTTLELKAASDEAVDITVEQDLDGVISQINSFVDAYNSLMDNLADVSKFDPETLERGILFSDHTIRTIRTSIQNMVQRSVPGAEAGLSRLSSIGVTFAPFGNQLVTGADGKEESVLVVTTPHLVFDEEKFRSAFAENPEGVEELFTKEDVGIGDYIADTLEGLAGENDSTIGNHLDAIQSRQKIFEKRIEDLNELLDAKETRLYNQFYAMEQALASLQTQQNALSSLSSMAAAYKS